MVLIGDMLPSRVRARQFQSKQVVQHLLRYTISIATEPMTDKTHASEMIVLGTRNEAMPHAYLR